MINPIPGQIVTTPDGKTLSLCYPARGGRWTCSDGWAYPLEDLTPADPTAPATRQEVRASQRAADLAADFDAWEAAYRAENDRRFAERFGDSPAGPLVPGGRRT